MAESSVRRIPIVSLADARYSRLARLITFPVSDAGKGVEFFPAIAGFNIGSGSLVDLSFLCNFVSAPSGGVDRHARTEELFVPLDGDMCLPLAPCGEPDNPASIPDTDEFVGVLVRHGQALILSANVWHNGGWPVDPVKGVRYIMVLSGHRPEQGRDGYMDFITATLPGGRSLLPSW